MKRNDLFSVGIVVGAAVGFAELSLRLRDTANSHSRYLRERWTLACPWERFDPRSGWELRAGYVSGEVRVNSRGFRGPEIRDAAAIRVLCLGGSSTFGPAGEADTYPHTLEEILNTDGRDDPVEVVNAGVTGHSTYNMLFRSEILDAAKPDVTVIMAGDDDLFREDTGRYRDNRQPFTSFWHIESQRIVRCHLWSLVRETAGWVPHRRYPVAYDPAGFIPFNFRYNLGKILDAVTENDSIPVLVTLPEPLPSDNSSGARSGAAFPPFLADGDWDTFLTLWRLYNAAIRALADERDILLIDAARRFGEIGGPGRLLSGGIPLLTPEGNRVLAEEIARGLWEAGLV